MIILIPSIMWVSSDTIVWVQNRLKCLKISQYKMGETHIFSFIGFVRLKS